MLDYVEGGYPDAHLVEYLSRGIGFGKFKNVLDSLWGISVVGFAILTTVIITEAHLWFSSLFFIIDTTTT